MEVANGPQSARVNLVGLSEYQQASGDQMVVKMLYIYHMVNKWHVIPYMTMLNINFRS